MTRKSPGGQIQKASSGTKVLGVFVVNDGNEVLLFKRRLYPPNYSVPAGHVEVALTSEQNAYKELEEETSLHVTTLVHVKDLDVSPDQCMSGADSHHWHLYQARVLGRPEVKINYEGGGAVWADLTKAKKLDLAPAIRTILDRVSFS